MRAGAHPPAAAPHALAIRTTSTQRTVGASRVAQATVVKSGRAQPAAVPAAPTTSHAQRSASTTSHAQASASTASIAAVVPSRTIDASTRPRPVPPPTTPPIVASDPRPAPDYAARANALIATQMPRIAQRAERAVLRVLFAAARADDEALRDGDVRDAAAAIQRPPDEALLAAGVAGAEARLLDESARVAFWQRGNAQQAIDLQTRAFGANPTDAQVAGNLAFLRLRQRPAQAELARELALHALTLRDARHPNGRIEDWTTFAIASALSGRDRDARNAWRVTVALAPQIERQCRVALDAYAAYGERLRPSVEAMLYRLNDSERSSRSPLCEWPPYWAAQR